MLTAMALRPILLGILGLTLVSCATPPPKADDYRRQVPSDYLGLMVDTDLLSTSRLDSEDKTAAQELLKTYYTTEYSLRTYIDALEAHLAENEQLTKDYSTADAYVGAVSGLSSIGVIFATAVVALPVTGVVWIAVSQYIQHYKIDPEIARTDRQLTEAQHLLRLFPDIEKIFDGLVYAETYDEAHRRFKKWAVYVKTLEARTAKIFAKTGDGKSETGVPATPLPQTNP
jgi:uncharacterized protein YktA (UPF0223 family)